MFAVVLVMNKHITRQCNIMQQSCGLHWNLESETLNLAQHFAPEGGAALNNTCILFHMAAWGKLCADMAVTSAASLSHWVCMVCEPATRIG